MAMGLYCLSWFSVFHSEGRAFFWPAFASVVESCCGDVGMAEPFLDLTYIGSVFKGIGCCGRSERVHTEAVDHGTDAGFSSVFLNDAAIDCLGIERF